jgi:hypothetical protein
LPSRRPMSFSLAVLCMQAFAAYRNFKQDFKRQKSLEVGCALTYSDVKHY